MHHSFQKLKWPLLSSILFFVIAVSFSVFLFSDIKKIINALKNNEILWHTEATRRGEVESLRRSLKSTEAERVLFDLYFIESSNVVPFLNMIDTLAPKAGTNTEISLVDLLPDNQGLLVEMRTQGHFGQVYKFLKLLETSPYELEFISADMYKASITDAKGEIVPAGWQGIFKVKVLTFLP